MSSSLQLFGERLEREKCTRTRKRRRTRDSALPLRRVFLESRVLACILPALIPPLPKLETTRGPFVRAPRLTQEGDLVEVVHHFWRESCLFFYFRTSLLYALIECLKNSDSNVRKVSVIIPFPLC